MKKIKFGLLLLFFAMASFTLPQSSNAETLPTVQMSTADISLYDESLQREIALLPKNSFVTVLSTSDGWAQVNYQSQIGYIQSEYLQEVTAQYLIIKSKTDPIVRVSDTQNSEVLGYVPINSIVKAYTIDSSKYSFVQYGSLTGYVQKQLLFKPTPQNRIVKGANGVNVYASAQVSAEQVGHISNGTTVSMLTKLNDWVFVQSGDVAGYIQGTNLKYPPTSSSSIKSIAPKPITPKPIPTTKKRVALTFDDGPHEKVTQQILKTLKKYNAKATFFVVGKNVKKNPSVLMEVFNAGHEIGNHTYNHPKLTTLTDKEIQTQIQSTNTLVKSVTGNNTTVFRPPYGSYNKTVINQLNVPNVLWTIDTLDWKHHDPKKTVQIINTNVKNGSIILMHDIHQTTADALDSVISTLQKQGYEFVTVSEILQK